MEINTYLILKVVAVTIIVPIVKHFVDDSKKSNSVKFKKSNSAKLIQIEPFSNNLEDFKKFIKDTYPWYNLKNDTKFMCDESLSKYEVTYNGNTVTFLYEEGAFIKLKIEKTE